MEEMTFLDSKDRTCSKNYIACKVIVMRTAIRKKLFLKIALSLQYRLHLLAVGQKRRKKNILSFTL